MVNGYEFRAYIMCMYLTYFLYRQPFGETYYQSFLEIRYDKGYY